MLGMVIATTLAMGTRRWGLGGLAGGLLSLLGLVWYLSLIFAGRFTWWSLPTPRSIERMGEALGTAWEHSRVDYAPVPERPGYAIAMVVATWVLSWGGETGTFRWRLPLIAAAGPVALFSAAMVLGTGEASGFLVAIFLAALLTYLTLEAGHRLRSWGKWVSPWAGGKADGPEGSGSTALARKMGAGSIAAALVAPFFLPAIGSGLMSWRNASGEGSGDGPSADTAMAATAGGAVDPWVSLEPQGILQSPDELLRVITDKPTYWRLLSLDAFEEGVWRQSPELLARTPVVTEIEGYAEDEGGDTLQQLFTISGLRGDALPAATQATQVYGGDVRVDPSGGLSLVGGLTEGLGYRVVSRTPNLGFKRFRKARPVSSRTMLNLNYVSAPPLSPDVRALVERWTAGAETPVEELIAIQERLRSDFRYTLDVPPRTPPTI